MSSVIQRVSNWLLGDYPVAVSEIGSGATRKQIQWVRLTDDSGAIVSPSGATYPGTATTSSVADSASNVTILAANTGRIGASIFNDSSALLYLKYGATAATSTDYTVRLYPNSYHEVYGGYTGTLTGIWDSDPGDGAARVTELTA